MDRTIWNTKALNRADRLARARHELRGRLVGKRVATEAIGTLLEATLEPGDRVCLEGNNQKQADFLAGALVQLDPQRVHGLHMVQSVLALPEHLDVFENGIARRLDFSFSGPQGARLAKLVSAGAIEIGAIHTYLELFARYFVDLTPKVALITAHAADAAGNLYTGPNTEDTPAIVEATAFSGGIVIAQVNEVVDSATTLPRIDIPGDWVDFVVQAPRPNFIEPLFTRDPAQISEIQVLMAMMAIKGIYAEYGVQRLNHGIGFDTAAIELLLPTYGESLGLKGKICRHWALNPHPALIPAIEAGWVESIHSFGSELGMEDYIRARADVFFTGADGSLRSNRAFCQAAGHYACDLFIGSTDRADVLVPTEVRRALEQPDEHRIEHMLDIVLNSRRIQDRPGQPTMIVWGAEDRLPKAELAVGQRLHKELPGSRLEVIQGAGHMPQVEQPERFVRVLRNFVSSL